jgi:hypothetical protein
MDGNRLTLLRPICHCPASVLLTRPIVDRNRLTLLRPICHCLGSVLLTRSDVVRNRLTLHRPICHCPASVLLTRPIVDRHRLTLLRPICHCPASVLLTLSDVDGNRLALSVSIVDVPNKSRTRYNGNASLERYRHANLLSDSMNLHFLTYFLFSRGVSSNRRWPWPLCFLIRWAGLLNLGISDKRQKATK